MSSKPSGRRLPTLYRCTVGVALGYTLIPGVFAAESPQKTDVVAPFEHYQRWDETPLNDWREANERVREVGGWRTYLREMQQDGDTAGEHHAH